jgi:hypothetical protein
MRSRQNNTFSFKTRSCVADLNIMNNYKYFVDLTAEFFQKMENSQQEFDDLH